MRYEYPGGNQELELFKKKMVDISFIAATEFTLLSTPCIVSSHLMMAMIAHRAHRRVFVLHFSHLDLCLPQRRLLVLIPVTATCLRKRDRWCCFIQESREQMISLESCFSQNAKSMELGAAFSLSASPVHTDSRSTCVCASSARACTVSGYRPPRVNSAAHPSSIILAVSCVSLPWLQRKPSLIDLSIRSFVRKSFRPSDGVIFSCLQGRCNSLRQAPGTHPTLMETTHHSRLNSNTLRVVAPRQI